MKKTMLQKACTASLVILTVTAGTAVLGAGSAQASMSCTYSRIVINSGSGAEPSSFAYGHSHRTGNHYIKSSAGGRWEYWADNNGGLDGDTPDTFYGVVQC